MSLNHFTAFRLKPLAGDQAGKVAVEMSPLSLPDTTLEEVAAVAWSDGFDLVVQWKAQPPVDQVTEWMRELLGASKPLSTRPGYLGMKRRTT